MYVVPSQGRDIPLAYGDKCDADNSQNFMAGAWEAALVQGDWKLVLEKCPYPEGYGRKDPNAGVDVRPRPETLEPPTILSRGCAAYTALLGRPCSCRCSTSPPTRGG